VPAQAFALALAASIYPPAVAAVIALGRGAQVRSRVFAFVAAAAIVTYAVGVAILLALDETGLTGTATASPGAAVDLVLGVALALLAMWLWLRRPRADAGPKTPSATSARIERHLQSRRLAFVLGLTLYALPSPIYIAAIKSVADAGLSRSAELAAVAAVLAVMLWMIELPMLALLVVPDAAADRLERINRWFARNGRAIAIVAAGLAGAYLLAEGIADLLG
jgi:hypothetical protein